MPIKYGTTSIDTIKKGTNNIVAAYKGSIKVFESFIWLPYSFEYLYNSLVPQTISGKNVKNKARVNTIYGNSVVENQLAKLSRETTTISGITFTKVDDYTFILNGTATDDINVWALEYSYTQVDTTHKYLVKGISGGSSTTYFYYINRFDNIFNDGIYSPTSSGTSRFNLTIKSGTTFNNQVFHIQFIDLTQMFPINTPTTLDDPRVQKLLNRGYIPYNSGEVKSADIGEISSEPYNLLDLTALIGGYSLNAQTGQISVNSNRCVSDFIPVDIGSYSFKHTINEYWKCALYDENKVYIKSVFDGTQNYTREITIKGYIRIGWDSNLSTTQASQDMFVRGTTMPTEYKVFKSFSPITFKYQGNGVGTAHDTMEITNTEYVFTKRIGVVDLGTLSWAYDSTNQRFYSSGLNSLIKQPTDSSVANLLCAKYIAISYNTLIGSVSNNNAICCSSGKTISIRDTSYTDPTDFKTAMSGVMLYYELATPQVIRIPRKHLGIVDLGSLEWNSVGGTGNTSSTTLMNTIKPSATNSSLGNIYSSFGKTVDYNSAWSNEHIVCVNSSSVVWVKIPELANGTAQQVKEKLSGVLLFYETANEVPDISTQIDIEAGGTLTTDSDVLPNVDTDILCQ